MPNQQQQSKKSSGFSLPPGTGTLVNALIPESFKASLPSFFTTNPVTGAGGMYAGVTAASAIPVLAPVALAYALAISSRKPPRKLTDLGQMPDVSKLSKVKNVSKKANTGVGGSNVDAHGNQILKTGYANLSATLDDDSVVDIANANENYLDIWNDQLVDRYYNKETGQLVSVPRAGAFKGGEAKEKLYGRTYAGWATGGIDHVPQGGKTSVGAYYKENQEKSPEEKAAEQAQAMMKSGVRSVSGSVSGGGGAMVANNPAPSQFKIFLDNFKKQQQSGAA
jgi:hypothetical protein